MSPGETQACVSVGKVYGMLFYHLLCLKIIHPIEELRKGFRVFRVNIFFHEVTILFGLVLVMGLIDNPWDGPVI